MERPGVIFRTGPTGRRADLAAGPDVWEVVRAVRSARAAEPDLGERELLTMVSENRGSRAVAPVPCRLLLDEMFPGSMAEQLCAMGHDVRAVVTSPEFTGLPDEEILIGATEAGRSLVTANIKDFMSLHARYRAANRATRRADPGQHQDLPAKPCVRNRGHERAQLPAGGRSRFSRRCSLLAPGLAGGGEGFGDALPGEFVGALVARVPVVSLDPSPGDLVRGHRLDQVLP
jgi:uncharacterized protein DUF5615